MRTLRTRRGTLAVLLLLAPAAGAQTILSGAALESGCREFSEKALASSREWEQLQCLKRLNEAPQLFTTEAGYHSTRCLRSVGTTIGSDLKSMEELLAKCRGARAPATAGRPPGTGTVAPPPPPGPSAGLWDVVVINSADLGRSEHTFMAGFANGPFTAQNARSGGPAFTGKVAGPVFEAEMTDATGYRASFVGRFSAESRVAGTGCDNRGRSFSFTMTRR